MTEVKNISKKDYIKKVEWKFYSYFIKYQLAKYDEDIIGEEIKENHNETIRLSTLDIDKQARERKEAIIKADADYKKSVSEEMAKKVIDRMEKTLKSEEFLRKSNLVLPEILFVILDKLYMKSTTLSHLESLFGNCRWLEKMILETIKEPFFANQLHGTRAKIDQLRTVIGLLGENNLKLLVPKYILSHFIPKDTAFPLIGRKIYEHSLMTANGSYHLINNDAKSKLNPFIAYTAGMLHELGTISLFKIYLKVFDDVWKEELQEARDKLDQKRFNAISKIEPSQKHMRTVFFENSRRYTKQIVETFNFERLPIQQVLLRFCDEQRLNEDGEEDLVTQYVDILTKSNRFAEGKELSSVNLINTKHFKQYLSFNKLNRDNVEHIAKHNLKSIPLFKTGD